MPQIAGKQLKDGTITATQVDTTTGTISTVNAGDSAAEGSAAGLSRKDHQHAVSTAAAGTIQGDDSAAEGSSSSLARADHTHAIVTAVPSDVTNDTAAEGSATSFSRSDHKHDITHAAASGITDSNGDGSATSLSLSDHTHKDAEQQESIDTENITGADTAITDTLAAAPRTGSVLRLFLNGVYQEQGSGKDYTLAGQTITWLASTGTAVDLETSDVLHAVYAT